MKKIGLISDTHSFLPDAVFTHFKDVDEIWHAGDVGDISVADRLADFKSFKCVYGNIDGTEVRAAYPLDLHWETEGFNIWMTHIGGYPGRYNRRVFTKLTDENLPDIFICGHSHILKVVRDKSFNNMLCLNPGAAGNIGLHKVSTLLRFNLADKKVKDMEVIEMERGKH